MKWGLRSPRGWIAHGVTPNAEIGTLALREWQNVPRPVRALGINASGEAARVRTEAQLTRWRVPIEDDAPGSFTHARRLPTPTRGGSSRCV